MIVGEHVSGHVEPGFEGIAAAFARNFEEHGELGAAVCAYVEGRRVVDVWGGIADKPSGRPWVEDTSTVVFSSTKGMTALCIALLVDRGKLRYDEPVATWWPEFAQAGKSEVTLRQLMSHQAGLAAIDEPLSLAVVADNDALAAVLERQQPNWPPGTAHGYHAVTFGWYAAELVRRVDGRSLGRFFADEVAGPLAVEFWIGLPADVEPRVATVEPVVSSPGADVTGNPVYSALADPTSLTARALTNPSELGVPSAYNDTELRALEIPSANGIGTARALAHVYAAMLDERIVSASLLDDATTRVVRGIDRVTLVETSFSSGWLKPTDGFAISADEAAFGHSGAGGSVSFADPARKVGFGYVMNQMGAGLLLQDRPAALIDALYRAL